MIERIAVVYDANKPKNQGIHNSASTFIFKLGRQTADRAVEVRAFPYQTATMPSEHVQEFIKGDDEHRIGHVVLFGKQMADSQFIEGVVAAAAEAGIEPDAVRRPGASDYVEQLASQPVVPEEALR